MLTIPSDRERAPRNRTITLGSDELAYYGQHVVELESQAKPSDISGKIINQNVRDALEYLPQGFVDLLFIDPPYNLSRQYNKTKFAARKSEDYIEWFEEWLVKLLPVCKPTASIYICSDWRTSAQIFPLLDRHLTVRNRITWERDKGRGALDNWKNCSEDIWFCTITNKYSFNLDNVKIKRKVIAPYTNSNKRPKDWQIDKEGRFRMTHPSNLWNDITVPFWSMPENTDHPTQKPEKLLARVILASTQPGDMVLDPFCGSGTTPVTAAKLERNFVGIELDRYYSCLALKRLALARDDKRIQGYDNGIFWERNSRPN